MKKPQKVYLFFRRIFDVLISFVGIIFCFVFLWWWILLINSFATNGHPFCLTPCLGKGKKSIQLIKFRTAISSDIISFGSSNEESDGQFETKFGKFLKKCHFVSMPYLLNVLIGNIAFIGPRPVDIKEEFDLVKEREKYFPNAYGVKPGISSFASLKTIDKDDFCFEAKLDSQYVKNINLFVDIKILFLSLFKSNKSRSSKTKVIKDNAVQKKKSEFGFFFVIVSFLAATLSSALIFTGTANYKLDNFAFKINDYNKHYTENGFKRPYVKIKKNDSKTLYNDLFSRFYYSDDSGSIRQYMDNECKMLAPNSSSKKIKLYSQSTFTISDNLATDGGYRIDYGVFHAYFNANELGNGRSYIGKRFNCDSYIFLSDTAADLLLEYYGLPNDEESKRDSYLKIVNEERYSILSIKIDEANTVTFSINNIIYSDKRTGPRCSEFNKYFGLINYDYVSKYFNPCFEMDFKSYSYYITSALKDTNKLGYTIDNSTFDFYTYDYEKNEYFLNEYVTNKFKTIPAQFNANAFDIIFYISLVIFGFAHFFLSLHFIDKKGDLLFCLIFELFWLVIYSIIGNFLYTCYAFSIMPVFLIILLFIAKGEMLIGPKTTKQD